VVDLAHGDLREVALLGLLRRRGRRGVLADDDLADVTDDLEGVEARAG